MIPKEIEHRLHGLFDRLRIEGIIDPIVAVEQISYLLLLRCVDEGCIGGLPYKMKGQFSSWQQIKQSDIASARNYIRDSLGKLSSEEIFAGVLKGADFIIENPRILYEAVDLVDGIFLHFEKEHNMLKFIGDIYEYMLSKTTLVSDKGEFYTPRHLIDVMVKMVSPMKGAAICDPACGTGGFLVAVNEFVKNKSEKYSEKSNTFTGADVNTRSTRLARLNMIFHGIKDSRIENRNVLVENFGGSSRFDIILSNPPIGGYLDTKSADSILSTNNINLLFIERIAKLLGPYGKCAVLVPESFLHGTSSAHRTMRKMLLDEYRVDGVVSLPQGVFLPYTNAKLSILFFNRINSLHIPNTETVWFYEATGDGYTLDNKRLSDPENNSMPDLLNRWKTRLEDRKKWEDMLKPENEQRRKMGEPDVSSPSEWDMPEVWFADYKTIEQKDFNLSADGHKPLKISAKEYESPGEILKDVLAIEEDVVCRIKKLLEETQAYEKAL